MDADQKGVLTREECDAVDLGSDPAKIDFDKLHENRLALLHKAYERSNIAQDGGFHAFCADNAWWMSRMWYSFKLYDVVRIDHFRGFDEYFSIPADAATARAGHWEKGPHEPAGHRGLQLALAPCARSGDRRPCRRADGADEAHRPRQLGYPERINFVSNSNRCIE